MDELGKHCRLFSVSTAKGSAVDKLTLQTDGKDRATDTLLTAAGQQEAKQFLTCGLPSQGLRLSPICAPTTAACRKSHHEQRPAESTRQQNRMEPLLVMDSSKDDAVTKKRRACDMELDAIEMGDTVWHVQALRTAAPQRRAQL